MTTRIVTGTILQPDGAAWALVDVVFTLLDEFATATETYPIKTSTVTTSAGGTFTTTLAVPDQGAAHYSVKLPDRVVHTFYLDSGPAVDLAVLITIASTAVAQDDLQTLLDSYTTFAITAVTGTYGMDGTEKYIRCTGAGNFTITLPAATGLKVAYAFKSTCAAGVTIEGAGADTIDGQLNRVIYQYENLTVLDAAAGVWDVVGG